MEQVCAIHFSPLCNVQTPHNSPRSMHISVPFVAVQQIETLFTKLSLRFQEFKEDTFAHENACPFRGGVL